MNSMKLILNGDILRNKHIFSNQLHDDDVNNNFFLIHILENDFIIFIAINHYVNVAALYIYMYIVYL